MKNDHKRMYGVYLRAGFLSSIIIFTLMFSFIPYSEPTPFELKQDIVTRVEDIGIIFNYRNNEDRIAEKIFRQSPPGTIFLYYTPQESKKFEGLKLEQSFEFDKQYKYFTNYLHVYRR